MLRIKKVKDGYIIYRDDKDGWHSHFSTYHKARTCLSFIERGIMPGNEYYIESCKRLLTGEEYNRLKHKQRYRNGQTGKKAYAKIL